MTRILVAADFHCGHRAGLTIPEWQHPAVGKNEKFYHFQNEMWIWYAKTMQELQPIDIFLFLGDAVEGKNERAGGTELLTPDRVEQADMAAACIKEAKASKVFMTYGTPYHTGLDEDWEDIVADKVGATISGHDWLEVNGKVFDYKHFIGSSTIPHGRYTALARAKLWNMVWSMDDLQPKADVILRAHVHYFIYGGDGKSLGIVLPGLQGYGSKFGIRRCEGKIDIGLIYFDIDEQGRMNWHSRLFQSDILKVQPQKL